MPVPKRFLLFTRESDNGELEQSTINRKKRDLKRLWRVNRLIIEVYQTPYDCIWSNSHGFRSHSPIFGRAYICLRLAAFALAAISRQLLALIRSMKQLISGIKSLIGSTRIPVKTLQWNAHSVNSMDDFRVSWENAWRGANRHLYASDRVLAAAARRLKSDSDSRHFNGIYRYDQVPIEHIFRYAVRIARVNHSLYRWNVWIFDVHKKIRYYQKNSTWMD